MITTTNQLVLPRGKLYFDRFAPGTRIGQGERYIGNTPQVSISHTKREIERAGSYRGQVFREPSYVAQESYSISFSTDNVDMLNIMLWFGSSSQAMSQNAAVNVTETLTVRRGLFYQLGVSDAYPAGVRGIETVAVSIGGVDVAAVDNFNFERNTGLLEILSAAEDIGDGATISVSYETRSMTSIIALPSGNVMHGSLRYVGDSAIGASQDYFFPMVAIKPSGDILMKSDEWQQWSFVADAMRLRPGREYVYITNIESTGYTIDEAYLINTELISLDRFDDLSTMFDSTINFQMPSRGYSS